MEVMQPYYENGGVTIYHGDCREVLSTFPDGSVDLVYIDPPFNTNTTYEIIREETGERRSFEDRFGNVEKYIEWMEPRCRELRRVLKPTGSFYYHCDPHASHYIKAMLDGVFGRIQFRNEIIWKRTSSRNNVKRWSPIHDVLLYYTKGRDFTWNAQYAPYSEAYLKTKYRYTDLSGRIYRLNSMVSPGPRPNMMYEWRGHKSPQNGWRYSKTKMAQLDREGRIWYPDKKSKRPRLKCYLDEMLGVPLSSVWTDIPPLNSQAKERVGYPTQKPQVLMQRIIAASSNEGDVILDAFMGSGTMLRAAKDCNRKAIGIDINHQCCEIAKKRLSQQEVFDFDGGSE